MEVELMRSPLKRVYKACQEKKERTSPRVPNGVCFCVAAPSSMFQKPCLLV